MENWHYNVDNKPVARNYFQTDTTSLFLFRWNSLWTRGVGLIVVGHYTKERALAGHWHY